MLPVSGSTALERCAFLAFHAEKLSGLDDTSWDTASRYGGWRCYINITITVLDIIHRPVFYLKLNSTYRFVRTSLETHYVSATSTAG
jgi:hypothetical protein